MNRRASYYILFGIFLFFLVAMSGGMILLPKGKALYHMAVAKKLLNAGDPQAAIGQAREAVELIPDSFFAVHLLVEAYVDADMHDEAERAVEELIEKSPDQSRAYYDLGMLKLMRRDVAGAGDAADKAISIEPDFAGGHHLLGAIAMDDRNIELAERHLTKAVELDPRNSESTYMLGIIHYEKKDFKRGIVELEKATGLRPDFAPAHAALAMCYFEQKLFIHALAELKTAVDLDPSDYNSIYNVACVYSLQGNTGPALKWLERAINNGFTDFEHMSEDHDLDNIRGDPRYIELVEEATEYVSPQPDSPESTKAGYLE